jgi:hypothetical protein
MIGFEGGGGRLNPKVLLGRGLRAASGRLLRVNGGLELGGEIRAGITGAGRDRAAMVARESFRQEEMLVSEYRLRSNECVSQGNESNFREPCGRVTSKRTSSGDEEGRVTASRLGKQKSKKMLLHLCHYRVCLFPPVKLFDDVSNRLRDAFQKLGEIR